MGTLNRLANCHNKFQGEAKKVLCVCSAGLLRSPTAANVLHREFGYNTRAAGASSEYALIEADEVLLEWADEIVCMQKAHLTIIADRVPEGKNIVVLDIPDIFSFMDEALQDLIVKRYKESLEDE